MIELSSVKTARQGVTLFEDLNLSLKAGEQWLLQGPNGSGKTLLLELLAGKLHPVKGEVRIDFIDGNTWDERYAQRRQFIHYMPAHAVQSLIKQDQQQYYQQRYYAIGDEQELTVHNLLGSVDALESLRLPSEFSIDHLLSLPVNRLSNGQLKKLLLIKVLLTGIPRVLLLDYPFEGLDRESRQALCRFIDFLIDEHHVQVMIADQHHELPARINRVLRMDNKKVVAHEPYHAPETETQQHAAMHSPVQSLITVVPVVEVSDLKIQYGEHIVLENFNWRVNPGERWALVGKNGSGKTTLFSMIFADHPMAYSQQVYLFGRKRGSGESIWDIKKRISYLGPEQLSYLSPSHIQVTAHEFLLRSLKHWDAHRFARLAKELDADDFLSHPMRVLSSGQLQVILIMQCLLSECELLLLDEPFQFLDEARKAGLNKVLNTYLDSNKTLILITHYAADLAQWTSYTKQL